MPRRGFVRQISDQESAYLLLLIADKNADSRKVALERIAKLYRSGLRFKNPERVIPYVIFLINDEHAKVRRWAFNALALIGSSKDIPLVVAALDRERGNPDIFAAAIAALSALANESETRRLLRQADLPLEGIVLLAAAQQDVAFSADLMGSRVDIEKATVPELRLATLLLGLKKAPENLFSAKYDNKTMIGELNSHEDELVSQYSVWAVYENAGMSIKDLRIMPKDFEKYHPGIRKYAYRILTSSKYAAKRNFDYIVHSSRDTDREAREGLAVGIRDLFFDGVEDLVLTWFRDEETDIIRSRLLEHMAVNVERAPAYKKPLNVSYESLPSGGIGRARLDAAAAGTSLFQEFKRIELEGGTSDMFSSHHSAPKEGRRSRMKRSKEDIEKIKVLIVTALPIEAAAMRSLIEDISIVSKADDPAIYSAGVIADADGTKRTVLTVNAGMGKSNASALGANAIRSFPKLEHFIMVGIAGGCPNVSDLEKDVRLGDVVFSSANGGVIEYDFVKASEEGVEIRRTPQRPSAKIAGAAAELQIGALAGYRPWEDMIDLIGKQLGDAYKRPAPDKDVLHIADKVVAHPDDEERTVDQPKVISGVIGSADTLQKSHLSRDELAQKFGVRAIEMEASGLQNSAWLQGKDIFVVRGICDYCDTYKNDIWQKYAAAAAAGFAHSLISAMPEEWFVD